LVSMWSRKGNKPAAGSVAVELDRHTCLDPHATAIGMNMQCGPQSADKIAACQDFWKEAASDVKGLDILLRQEERPEIPQTVPRPRMFLVPNQALEDEVPPPPCSRCSGRMAWSSRRDGLYCQGWHCDNFAACGSSCASRGPHRWHCPGCCADVCGACAHVPGAPPPGGPEELGPPVVSRMAPARRQNPRAAVPSPTPRPGGLTLVAPCPEFGVQPEPPDGPAPSSAEEPAQEEGAYFSSLGVAALRTWDLLVAAGDAPSSSLQRMRPVRSWL